MKPCLHLPRGQGGPSGMAASSPRVGEARVAVVTAALLPLALDKALAGEGGDAAAALAASDGAAGAEGSNVGKTCAAGMRVDVKQTRQHRAQQQALRPGAKLCMCHYRLTEGQAQPTHWQLKGGPIDGMHCRPSSPSSQRDQQTEPTPT